MIRLSPHIRLGLNPENSSAYKRVLVCGSPERAAFIAGCLDEARDVAKNREYHSYLGLFQGREVLVTSHGVGSAGAAICFQELIDIGAQAIIRVGTAGGLYDNAAISDIVVPTAAIRKDGVSRLMVPAEFPAVPDSEMAAALASRIANSGLAPKRGIILTSDLYYRGPLDDELAFYKSAGAVAVEMECSTLFVIGALRKIRTAAAVVLDGSPLKWNEGEYDNDPKRLQDSIVACAKAALETLAAI